MTYLQEINKNLNDGNFKIKVGILKKKVVNSKVNIGKSDLRVKNFNFKEKITTWHQYASVFLLVAI